jgi:hypothetical protein
VRKAKLLSSVAVALLLSAGVASAQGMSKDTPERAPAAQQNAPAEKVAPAVKSEQKAPQTTGQATPDKSDKALQKSGQAAPDAKSGKAKETTGQAPKSDADEKAQAPSRSMDNDKKSGAADSKSDPNGAAKSTQSTTDQKSKSTQSTTQENRSTTGQGAAAGSANLSTEQRTKITTIIRQHKVEPAHLSVSVSVGTRVPTNVRFYPLPVEVITIYPQWRGYEYILVGEQIVIIDPRTHEIVAIVEA